LLEQKERELAALEERFLRQAADFQNFKKRALEERSLSIDIGRTQVAMPMIEVLDDLRRSLEAADQAGRSEASAYHALRDGVKLVFEKFETELGRIGIKPMETVGKKFDEEKHEALLQQPAPPGTDVGTILAEVQKGYLIGDRVLRHARVVVAA
jgi:molecular chaperone GrpE